MVFVFNSMPDAWQEALPKESGEIVKEIKGFPGIDTTKMDYDSDTAIYLTQLAS